MRYLLLLAMAMLQAQSLSDNLTVGLQFERFTTISFSPSRIDHSPTQASVRDSQDVVYSTVLTVQSNTEFGYFVMFNADGDSFRNPRTSAFQFISRTNASQILATSCTVNGQPYQSGQVIVKAASRSAGRKTANIVFTIAGSTIHDAIPGRYYLLAKAIYVAN